MILRPYQTRALSELAAAHAAGARSVVLVMPTGSGKTVTAAEEIRREVGAGGLVLFVAHRKELVDQASRKLDAFEVPHGIVMAGTAPDTCAPVQVASIQTLIRRDCPWAGISAPSLVVIDEAHHASASSYRQVIDRYPEARVLGLTATPFRADGQGLGDVFHAWVRSVSISELMAGGFLVRARYWGPSIPDLRGVRRRGGDFDPDDLAGRMSKPRLLGDLVSHYLRLANTLEGPRRAVLFAVNQDHSRAIADEFQARGIPAAHLGDDVARVDREAILAAHEAGEVRVITNVNILSEGYDSPAVEVAILARPTMSLGLHLQQIGRVLRPHHGKPCAIVIDHAGNVRRHGFADADHPADLAKGASRRQAETGPALRTCPTCYAVLPAGSQECPCCWAKLTGPAPRTIIHADGHLEELTKPACACGSFDVEKRPHELHGLGLYCAKCGRWLKWLGKPDESRAAYLARKLAVAREKGFKPGWAAFQFKARFGAWPGRDVQGEAEAILEGKAA